MLSTTVAEEHPRNGALDPTSGTAAVEPHDRDTVAIRAMAPTSPMEGPTHGPKADESPLL
jgi:hypothetical protein